MPLSAEEKGRIMRERGESGRVATGNMRRFTIQFTDGKSTTMLDPKGGTVGDVWESAEDRLGKGRINNVIVQGED
ncbi:hypothetical protein VRRI112168_03460 [Vreelandella rituensis]|uniref:Uncharacterized protein n=1 Tax=Vreelandella rituensis TaxID=2282306 RepID=A0A368U9V5_9GAMM|nr:hypothetical protein DU506_00730 [Halomonas rituensis]